MRRLLAMLPLALLPATAAAMPKNNIPGVWAEDQAKAAEWWLLTPHTWSIVFAVLFVLLAGFVTWYGLRHPRHESPAAPDDMDPLKHKLALWGVIAALVLFYAPGLAGDFSIYDDPQNIWLDDRITEFTWEHVKGVLLENHRGVNQEWMFFSFQLNWLAHGKTYWAWYATNLAFFPLILLLVHRLAHRLSGSRWVGLLAVPFFALSPIVAEILCWMMTRGHYFGLLFGLASLVAYLEYLHRRAEGGWRRWGLLALSVLAFAASQMGKPIYLYVPVWIVLFDLWFRRRDWLRAGLEKIPYAVAGLVFLRKIVEAGGDRNRIAKEWIGGSFVNTLALDANQFLEYLRSTYMPHQSGLRIPWNEPASWLYVTGVPNIMVFGFSPLASAVILLSILVIAAVLAWRLRWGYLLLALVASIVTFLPVANIPTHTVVAAYRYTLSANVMSALVLAAACVHLAGAAGPLRRGRSWLVPAAAAWMMLAAYHANANRAAWRAPVDLWTRNARVLYPYDGWAHYYAGKTLNKTDRHHEAAAQLELSQLYLPQNDMVYRRLGDSYYYLGMHRKAEEYYREYFAHNRHRVNDYFGKRLVSLGLEDLVPEKHRP